jgi:hypothetical protein
VLSDFFDKGKSIEELEKARWPPLRSDSASPHRAGRGSSAAPSRGAGLPEGDRSGRSPLTGWYDDDLLSAVLTRKAPVWRESSAWARHLNQTVGMLTDLSPYIQREVDEFHAAVTGLL